MSAHPNAELLARFDAAFDRHDGTAMASCYAFPQTGRPVVNDIRSTFRFADGRIAEQRDDFSFYRWARQALGAPGLLFGWSPPLRSTVRRQARASLDAWMRHRS